MKRSRAVMKKQMGNSRSSEEDESARKKSKGMEEKMESNELLVAKKTSQTTTAGFDIPMDVIINNILFKIPPQFINDSFRYVSKKLNSFVSTPDFAHQNFAYSKPKFILHNPGNEFPQNAPAYEMENGEIVPSGSISRSGVLINSCNGLLLIKTGITFQVTNPITKKIVSLPDCPSNCKHDYCLCFLAFDSSSNLFKVIHGFDDEYHGFEILSLGVDSTWRNVRSFVDDGTISRFYTRTLSSDPVCINGKLHWLEPWLEFLISMDLSDETAYSTPVPHTGELVRDHYIMEMGGYLGHIAITRSRTTIDIWMLKDSKTGEWIHRHTIDAGSVNWDAPTTPVPTSDLIKFLFSGSFPKPELKSFTPLLSTNNGNILLFTDRRLLYSYDITSSRLKKLKIISETGFNMFLVHRDSLISWEAPDK